MRTARPTDNRSVNSLRILSSRPARSLTYEILLSDLHNAVGQWFIDGLFVYDPPPEVRAALTSDPEFPFGIGEALYAGDPGTGGYRGPGGSLLTWDFWHGLEIRNGHPVLYIHAGAIAG